MLSSSVTYMWCKMIDSDFCNCHLGDDSNPKPYEGQLAASFKHLEHSKRGIGPHLMPIVLRLGGPLHLFVGTRSLPFHNSRCKICRHKVLSHS
jgi:hypothetical protein